MKTISTLLLLASLLNPHAIFCQDPHFSMFFANPVYLNPSYAGYDQGATVALNYHEQWPGFPDGKLNASPTSYRTANVRTDYQIPCFFHSSKAKVGLSGAVFYDGAGAAPLNTAGGSLAISYSYKIIDRQANYFQLRIGWQTSMLQRWLDYNYLIYSDQLNPYFGLIGAPTPLQLSGDLYFSHNFGAMTRLVLGQHTLFTLGGTVSNLLKPRYSLWEGRTDSLPKRWTVHAGGTFPLRKPARGVLPLYLTPQFRWEMQSGSTLQLMTAGMYFQTDELYFGAFYQGNVNQFETADARLRQGIRTLSLSLGFDVKIFRKLDTWDTALRRRFIIGFSYDASLTNLRNRETLGGLELNLRMDFPGDPKATCANVPVDVRRCPLPY